MSNGGKESLLEVRNLTKRFRGVIANQDINMEVNSGEIIGLIGPNGAGKTTLFNMITGTRPKGASRLPDSGAVYFKRVKITGMKPNSICKLGLVRTFQLVRIWEEMTVLENVMTGVFRAMRSAREARKKSEDLLKFTGLYTKLDYLGSSLTIADKKRLEITRALGTKPDLLLLDEPMAGLTTTEINEALELIRQIHDQGITVLLVEHVIEAVMSIAHRVVVLDNGQKIADDRPEKVARDKRVIEAYLGEEYHVKS
ncbi:MAG: ABC transporter ATP-binding protein [Candidatus Aerophobetes bacterium]|nr:ABC transporter ATP-binding protein [Candidatus Aerophobetes bacterium]